ncbi:unnamed protein product [Orchesella dallaii]|uniref:C2 domain-containing protein n=1 Tax=Orchesella dallaii TaxID=48710 RepID=A0ABP1PV45_9HEXA
MSMKVLTSSEKLLLSSVGIFATSLTLIVIFCVVKKNCWLHKIIWNEDKKKKHKLDDMICIRYPPDIYPPSIGIYRENIIRSPEDELARLFHSPAKRDSTYSSMSETSSSSTYDLSGSSQRLTSSSGSSSTANPTPVTNTTTPETPGTAAQSPDLAAGGGDMMEPKQQGESPTFSTSSTIVATSDLSSTSETGNSPPHNNSQRAAAAALAAEAVAAANQRHNNHYQSIANSNIRQPFFTFALKYEEDNNLVRIDFIEARNLPLREYVNQPCDIYFTLEIQPKNQHSTKPDIMRYRFVTKTLKKAADICDFSEKFLAQLSKSSLKNYILRFTAFDQDKHGNPTELGSTTLTFDDFRDFTLQKLILSCSLQEPIIKRGEIMIGLCYLPTAERMSVTIVKATNLNPYFSHGTITKQSICYVRLLLLKADTGRVLKKKKTTFQKLSGSNGEQPVFNETLVFDMPPNELIQTVVLALVCFADKPPVPKHHRSDAGSGMGPQQSHPSMPYHDDSLFHFSGNLNNPTNIQHPGNGHQRSNKSHSSNEPINGTNNGGQNGGSTGNSPEQGNYISNESPATDGRHKSKGHKEKDVVVGKVAFGCCVKNPIGRFHWEKMVLTPRTVVNEWHYLK